MHGQPPVPGARVAGKVALVTGAASGIGRATAQRLASEGARVVVTDVNEAGGQETVAAIGSAGGQAVWQPLDVTAEAAWEAAMAGVPAAWGPLDVLVANAGISFAKPVADMTLDEWRRVMAINLDGVFLGVKHGVRAMRRGRGGSIVIVGSASGIKATPGASAYGASKAALRLFAKAVALECRQAGDGIRVNCIHPAGVATPMWKSMPFWDDLLAQHGDEAAVWRALGNGERFAEPAEIATAILYLASDESAYVNGADLVIDNGYTV